MLVCDVFMMLSFFDWLMSCQTYMMNCQIISIETHLMKKKSLVLGIFADTLVK